MPKTLIYCRTLGPPAVTVNDEPGPAELLWRKHVALLVYLARSPRRTRTRAHLVGLLWGDKPESSARHSLREAVRILRRVGGDGAVEASSRQIALAEDAVRLDVEDLDALANAEEWERGAALVHGEFLEGFTVPDASGFETWLGAERLHWRQRAVLVLACHGEQLLAQGRAPAAADLAHRAIAIAPLSEVAIGLALRATALSAGRNEALTAYEDFASRLRAETGSGPGAALQDLARRISAERLPIASTHAPMAAETSTRRAPLVGRETELALLTEAWNRCLTAGHAAALLVQGDPGLGKTRLIEELSMRARLAGAVTALVRAVPADTDLADSGVWALADSGLVEAPGVGGARSSSLATFAQRLPAWAQRFRVGSVEPEPVVRRAFGDVIDAIAGEQPVLLTVDDAHWIDAQSLEALEALLRDQANRPVAVALATTAAAVPATLDRLRVTLGRGVGGVIVRLAPLGTEALRQLAAWALPAYTEEELDRVTRRVRADSAGFPLLAVELLHAVALGLELGEDAATRPWPEPARTLDQTLPGALPDVVVAAIRTGFRRLTREAQQVLQAGALLGERFTLSQVAAAAALNAEETAAALDELEWERWLTADPRGYGYVARIVRNVVAADLLTAGQRQRILDRLDA